MYLEQKSTSMIRACRSLLASAGLVIALAVAGPAAAAPQMLVLLESRGLLPVQCGGGRCVVELATMCLQPERRMPEAGRTYRTLDGAAITVAGLDKSGQVVRRSVPESARIKALRGHLAVTLEISSAWLGQHFSSVHGIAVAGGAVLWAGCHGGRCPAHDKGGNHLGEIPRHDRRQGGLCRPSRLCSDGAAQQLLDQRSARRTGGGR